MIEPNEFQESIIEKTSNGGTCFITTFCDYKTGVKCPFKEVMMIFI